MWKALETRFFFCTRSVTSLLLLCYCSATASLLLRYCSATAMLHYCSVTVLLLLCYWSLLLPSVIALLLLCYLFLNILLLHAVLLHCCYFGTAPSPLRYCVVTAPLSVCYCFLILRCCCHCMARNAKLLAVRHHDL